MSMKSYFCERCGREYQYNECLHDGAHLYCYDCPTARLHIAGWPLIIVGIFIGVMFFIYESIPVDTYGGAFVFLPASLGLMLVGMLRLLQTSRLREKALQKKREEVNDEDDVPVNVPREPDVDPPSVEPAATDDGESQ